MAQSKYLFYPLKMHADFPISFLGLFTRPGNFQFLSTASQSLGELLTELSPMSWSLLAEDHPFLGTKKFGKNSNHCQIHRNLAQSSATF